MFSFKSKPISYAHVVIDAETMSLSPNAAVMSIGALNFDLHTGIIRSYFQVNVNADVDSVQLGGAVSKATVDWWNHPNQHEARFLTTQQAVSPAEALSSLVVWLQGCLPELWIHPHRYCVWTMGSEFDPPILNEWSRRILNHPEFLERAMRHYQAQPFLPSPEQTEKAFQQVATRDLLPRASLACMRFMFKLFEYRVARPKTVAHVAADDALAQYHSIMSHRRLGIFRGAFNPLRSLP